MEQAHLHSLEYHILGGVHIVEDTIYDHSILRLLPSLLILPSMIHHISSSPKMHIIEHSTSLEVNTRQPLENLHAIESHHRA